MESGKVIVRSCRIVSTAFWACGGLNGSTLHSARTQLEWKQRAESPARVGSVGTLPWL